MVGSNDNSVIDMVTEGGAVAPGKLISSELPQFHLQGTVATSHVHLNGIYEDDDLPRARHLVDKVVAHLRDNAPQTARRVLETDANALDSEDLTAMRVRVAAGLLYDHDDKQALALAEQTIADHCDDALWTAGLAAYRLGLAGKAAGYFRAVADTNADAWTTSAAAFWAARALTKAGDKEGANRWLALAATHKGTFYGLLAQRTLDDATTLRQSEAQLRNASYIVPRWKPQGGFTVDPALVFAIMRQESQFDPEAESNAGALGLMQIMPRTAGEVMQRQAKWSTELLNPEINMDIGQRYVRILLQSDGISNNLIRMAAAYNGGPNALGKFQHANSETDPLLFIETIPAGETRGFVEQVMTNYWSYRSRLGEDTASLTDLAAGKWPLYTVPASKPTLVADAR